MFIARFYQDDCLRLIQRARRSGKKEALAVMASGLGKTVTMALDTERFRRDYPRARVLYLCQQNHILHQARGTFEAQHGSGCSYGFYNGVEKSAHKVDFLFASLQTMRKCLTSFRPDEFDYVVVDESHHTYADTYLDVVTYWKPKFLLGMTATPDRTDGQDIRKVFGREVFCLPLEDALAQNLLTPVEYRLMSDEIELKRLLQSPDRRLSVNKLNRTIFVPKRDEEIVRIINRHGAGIHNPRTIIFCQSIAYCEHLSRHVKDSVSLHSGIPLEERVVRVELFRQGVIPMLLAVDVLNEGVDIPQANVLVFLRSTTSPVVFLQQLGRGLRLSEEKDKVVVLDFVGNCERVQTVYELWQKVKARREQLHTQRQAAGQRSVGSARSVESFTINATQMSFKEKVVALVDLVNRINAEFYPTWQEASATAIGLGVASKEDYAEKYVKDPRLPSSPMYTYRDFPGWRVFLGRKKWNFYSYKKASKVVQRMRIKNEPEYQSRKKEDERLPGDPPTMYKNEWQGWPVFFGGLPRCRTWRIAARLVRQAGVQTKEEYLALCDREGKLPRDPWTFYKDFPGWPTFFGRKSRQFKKNPYKTWRQAARAARKLGATTCALYKELHHKDPRLYADPLRVYPDCPDWHTFFGK